MRTNFPSGGLLSYAAVNPHSFTMLDAKIQSHPARLADTFGKARPFRHWVVDGFLTESAAEGLLREFPAFERGDARNEGGALGGKSVVEQILQLGPSYQALDDLVKSSEFLRWLSAATGIAELRYDPWYFGGGTHENREGQELDPHIDFNRHPKTGQHRRLNLIIYLNKEWDERWGGALELHSDPHSENDQVSMISPLFNRAVLFETTELSWHGFSKIRLPEGRRDTSRKSIALYFYTDQRPAEEFAPEHSTVYVDRPLPTHYSAGYTLSEADVQELKILLARRDQHVQRLYSELQRSEGAYRLGAIERLQRWSLVGSKILGHMLLDTGRVLSRIAHGSRPNKQMLETAFANTINAIPEHRRPRFAARPHPGPSPATKRPSADLANGGTAPASDESGAATKAAAQSDPDYAARVQQEQDNFKHMVDVHALPDIFHYWSNKYLLPMLQAHGFSHPEDFFAKYLLEAAQRAGSDHPRFVSVGSGNCDAEVRIALDLRKRGLTKFTLECLDINETMLARGRQLAEEHGVSEYLAFTCRDFNAWSPHDQYAAVMANQSLHHVLDLECLFDRIGDGLLPEGLFITSDMIGRNGHLRWPESKEIVDQYWQRLPESYRFNLQLQRQETQFMDWDCSVDCFEGIRAQDILALLLDRFGIELFIGFGNIIDPFIDRGFGHHFSAEREWDRSFIDEVHARDEAELAAGTVKPTHMIAVMTLNRDVKTKFRGNLSPAHCLRSIDNH